MRRITRDTEGASLIEFTLVFPLILLVALGTVDAALVLFDHAQANKAAQRGARVAVISPPVAQEITNPAYDLSRIGETCFDPDEEGIWSYACGDDQEDLVSTCTPNALSGGQCSNGYTFNETAFFRTDIQDDGRGTIFGEMSAVFPRIQRENVAITYRATTLGFSGRPGGIPMEVTVEIRCMTSQLFFLGALMGWVLQSPAGCPNAQPGWQLPPFATTLSSEAMDS